MGTDILYAPSFYAHLLNGFFLVLSMIIFAVYIKKVNKFNLLILLLLLSIAVGIHGISHIGLETKYGMYPYNMFFSMFK